MSSKWQTIQSFGESQGVLSAINTISIHLKLQKAGISDKETSESIKNESATIISFLKKLERIIDASSKDQNKPILGANARLLQLGHLFMASRKKSGLFHSVLFSQSPSFVIDLLKSNIVENCETLLPALKDLRLLIEKHMYADTKELLVEI